MSRKIVEFPASGVLSRITDTKYQYLSAKALSFASFGLPLRTAPSTMVAFGALTCKLATALPKPEPPEVANRTIFLPEKSYASKKLLMIVGATYHQIGKPTKMVS